MITRLEHRDRRTLIKKKIYYTRRVAMAIVIDHESEYKGEQKIRNAIAEYFSDDDVVYNNREVNGREYDICLLAKDVCVFFVEV